MMHFTSVLLPAPFSPSRACTVPRRRRSETSDSAISDPKCLLTDIASSARSAGGGAATISPLIDDTSLAAGLPSSPAAAGV